MLDGSQIVQLFHDIPADIDAAVRDFGDAVISPGFIDVHVHGANGCDFLDGSYESFNEVSKFLAATGTTGFLATTLTASPSTITNAIETFLDAKARHVDGAAPLGVHLEGPFINEDKRGAQNRAFIRKPDPEELREYADRLGPYFKLITLAPELDSDFCTIQFAKSRGAVVSAGHTTSDYDTARLAFDAGVRHVTHLFNAMEPLHHRSPGLVAAALTDQRVSVELIADTIHVHPGVLKTALAAKERSKVTLITDCMRAANLTDGMYSLGGLDVIVKDGIARTQEGNLAGSTLRMIDAVRNIVEYCGISLPAAVQMASLNPATELGLGESKGSLDVGKDADITVFTDDFSVIETYVAGEQVYHNVSQDMPL